MNALRDPPAFAIRSDRTNLSTGRIAAGSVRRPAARAMALMRATGPGGDKVLELGDDGVGEEVGVALLRLHHRQQSVGPDGAEAFEVDAVILEPDRAPVGEDPDNE